MPIIFFSKGNLAGENIAEQLIAKHGFEKQEDTLIGGGNFGKQEDKLVGGHGHKNSGGTVIGGGKRFETWSDGNLKLVKLDTLHLESDYLADCKEFESDLVVFASTHKSAAEKQCFTAHACGNWGPEALLGGRPRELAMSSPKALKCAYLYLKSNELPEFPAFVEATHHGPTRLESPVLFVEVGSNEAGWKNQEACAVAADCIMHVCKNYGREAGHPAVGLGGLHYAPKFSKLMEDEGHAFSHIASKHYASFIDSAAIEEAARKTAGPKPLFLIEKKSLRSVERLGIEDAVKQAGFEYDFV